MTGSDSRLNGAGQARPRGVASGECGHCGGETPCDCRDRLGYFRLLMEDELFANASKGGRNGARGWITADADWLLYEVQDHLAKLHVATKELLRRRAGRTPRMTPWTADRLDDREVEIRVREFAADTANMTMMLLDTLGLLAVQHGAPLVGALSSQPEESA